MCKVKAYKGSSNPRIDKCMRNLIDVLNTYVKDYKILACCCGHGKYPMTIVFDAGYGAWELISDVEIPKKKRFYKRDEEGYYYIPELQ